MCALVRQAPHLDQAEPVEDVVKSLRNFPAVQRKAMLEEGARKEGEVIWYTSMSLTDFPKIVGAFEKSISLRQDSHQSLVAVIGDAQRSKPKRGPGTMPSIWWARRRWRCGS